MMDCKLFLERLHPWVDGELDLIHSLEMERHLDSCASCLTEYTAVTDLKSRLAKASLAFTAPTNLLEKVRENLIAENRPRAIPSDIRRIKKETVERRSFSPWIWSGSGALVTALLAFAFLIPMWFGHSGRDALAEEMIAGHVRSLQADHLFDVESTDQHTVKPWFEGKVDFSPPVQDFAAEGFPLIGGRLDYLDKKPVAVMVYRRHLHAINLFCWPAENGVKMRDFEKSLRGFHVLFWNQNGFEFGAVSDLNETELEQFMQLRRQTP